MPLTPNMHMAMMRQVVCVTMVMFVQTPSCTFQFHFLRLQKRSKKDLIHMKISELHKLQVRKFNTVRSPRSHRLLCAATSRDPPYIGHVQFVAWR